MRMAVGTKGACGNGYQTHRLLCQKTTMGNDHKPDPKAFLDNLKGPMPIQKKLFLFLKNNARKIVTAKSCCGHPGEPGC